MLTNLFDENKLRLSESLKGLTNYAKRLRENTTCHLNFFF